MNRWVIIGFILAVAAVAAITAWSFRSGLTWTGICLIAVAGPLALLYWYMLLVNPARAEITADADGLLLSGPPFLDLALPWSDVVSVSRADLKTDPLLAVKSTKRGMKFGQYRCGTFTLAGGGEAFVLGNSNEAVFVDAGEVRLLLAPDKPDELLLAVQEHTS
jgi:hypothetical protein